MIEVLDARVSYGVGTHSALDGVSCVIRAGELVAVTGVNGSGKSTLGALLCGMRLADAGSVRVDGLNPAANEDARLAMRAQVGMVQQDPVDQIVSTLVFDEVAFGPRNLGCSEDEVAERVLEALERTGLSGFDSRATTELSGGEQQRVALAGMLAMRPRYLVLDEATCQLDSAARPAFLSLFKQLAHEEGLGVVQITHDPAEILASDRVLALKAGRVAWEGAPRELLLAHDAPQDVLAADDAYVRALRAAIRGGIKFDAVPAPDELMRLLAGAQGGLLRDGLLRDEDMPLKGEARGAAGVSTALPESAALLVDSVCFSYGKDAGQALEQVSFNACSGRVLLLAGRSGSGKSTVAQIATGLLEPASGSVTLRGASVRVGDCALALQNPEAQFFLDTVYDELAFAARNRGMAQDEVEGQVRHAAALVGLSQDLLGRYPFDVSGGQARRIAIASVLTLDAGTCILDEPSAGLDAAGRHFVRALARTLAKRGMAVIVISHDLGEWLEEADDVVLLAQGRVAWRGPASACADDPAVFERCGLAAPFGVRLRALARGDVRLSRDDAPAAAGCAATGATRQPTDGHVGAEASAPPRAPLDARVSIIGLLALTLCMFLCRTPTSVAVFLLITAVAVRVSGRGVGDAARALRPISIVLAFALCANLVSCDGRAAIPIAGLVGISPEGGLRGLVAVTRIVALVACSLAVAATTSPTQISDAVVRLLRPFERVGLPVGALGTVLSVALRFIPITGEELQRIRTAQRARGVRFDEGSALHRVRVWTSVLTPLIVGLFRRADHVAEAMAARCYAGGRTVQVPRKPLGRRDRLALAAFAALVAAMLTLSWKGLI